MPEIDLTYTLTDSELDAVSGGAGPTVMATLTISSFFASGPNSAIVNADIVTLQTQVIPGTGTSAPSATANISGTFTGESSITIS
jgi:hypothetical protein